jgi:hypothetical protein
MMGRIQSPLRALDQGQATHSSLAPGGSVAVGGSVSRPTDSASTL